MKKKTFSGNASCVCGGELYIGLFEMKCEKCKNPKPMVIKEKKKTRKQLEDRIEELENLLVELQDKE